MQNIFTLRCKCCIKQLDCFVATLLAMTVDTVAARALARGSPAKTKSSIAALNNWIASSLRFSQ